MKVCEKDFYLCDDTQRHRQQRWSLVKSWTGAQHVSDIVKFSTQRQIKKNNSKSMSRSYHTWNRLDNHVFEEERRNFFPSEFWQLSQCSRCHDQASKRNMGEEMTRSEDSEAHKACYHPDFWLFIWCLTDSSLFQPLLFDPLASSLCQYCVTYWPLGTVHPGSVDIRHPLVDRQTPNSTTYEHTGFNATLL